MDMFVDIVKRLTKETTDGAWSKRRQTKTAKVKTATPKRRQSQTKDKGNITKTATEKCGQNGDKEQRTAKCFKEDC